jgi:hypothetical protein
VASKTNPVDMGTLASVQMYGLDEMLKQLRQIDPALRKATLAKMRIAAEPMVREARSLIPEQSGLDNWGTWPRRTGGYNRRKIQSSIKVSYKGGRIRDKKRDTFPLFTMVMRDAGGSVYDRAGRKFPGRRSEGKARGRAMVEKLRKEHGDASRAMWRAAEEHMPAVQQGIEDAIAEMEYAINKRVERIR